MLMNIFWFKNKLNLIEDLVVFILYAIYSSSTLKYQHDGAGC